MATAADKFAQEYGYQLAFLKSDKELYGVFQKAMKGQWDATKFVAAVKNSKWYRTHGEAYRTNLALKTTDPGTWNQKISAERARIADVSSSLGATLNPSALAKITEDSTLFGWNDNQLRDAMSSYIKTNPLAVGTAGEIRSALQQTAYRNGVGLTESYSTEAARRVAAGQSTLQDEQQRLRALYAKSIAPGFAKEIEGGQDLVHADDGADAGAQPVRRRPVQPDHPQGSRLVKRQGRSGGVGTDVAVRAGTTAGPAVHEDEAGAGLDDERWQESLV